jgi:uncharacterized protein YndB with AHSA1/START domain
MQTSQEKNIHKTAHLKSTPQARLLKVEHKYSVPVTRLFEAFKSAEALKAWWWPEGLHADRVDLEFREGGKYFINMKGFDQGGGGMTGSFEEIVENRRIVMSDQFADENGRPISAAEAKMPGEWPEIVYITLDFEPVGKSTSRVLLSQEGIPNEAQRDCIRGWKEMFNKLGAYLGDRKH